MSESAIAVRGNQIQRGDRQWRAALSGHGKDLRRLQSIRDDPPAAVAIINTEPRLQEDGIGPGRDALKDRREDVPEAHLFPRPDRIQQNASSNPAQAPSLFHSAPDSALHVVEKKKA